MDLNKLTLKTQEILQYAQQLAHENGNQSIESGHVLRALLSQDKDVTPYLLDQLKVNSSLLETALNRILEHYSKVSGGQMYMSKEMNATLINAFTELKKFGDEYVSIELLLYAMVASSDSIGQLLRDNGINKKNLKSAIMELRNGEHVTSNSSENNYKSLEK